ncbi:hypothetical protein GCM10025868_38220 [Angustibacter aerolatus]|uniref:Solute-binding protein family 3/N-terminal domain-containing protein n=1 Tax=Angustibacter aerolatus TaxID=1162965 RepID=A0ABQ6JK16_9ACTN|nr:transporter substrate-binding domain-containing protein [Angustibacter aerolatus]GMA88572.1 hypothetical protein GCM10025868_38220 [Angustibacter aerolatus]
MLDYLKSTGDTSVKIAVQTDDVTKQAFVFRKGDPLAGQVDGALKTLQQNGTLEQISDKYFGQDVSGDAAVGASASPSPSSASLMDGHPTLRLVRESLLPLLGG